MSVLDPLPLEPAPLGAAEEPLPLPAPGWGAAEARRAVAAAAAALGLPDRRPVLVRALTTVVLRVGGVAAKVYPPGTSASHLEAQRLALTGSASAVIPFGPPVTTADGVVTAMPWLPSGPDVGWAELGAVLRRFHDEHRDAALPRWSPLRRLPSQVDGLPAEAAAVLLGARAELLTALASVRSELGAGVLHGDVSPSNVMTAPDGPRLIDLDSAGRGPLEYDLSSAARRRRAGEIDRHDYAAFCRAYGHDVLGWPGLELLDLIADLDGVAFRLWDDRHRGRDLGWLAGELRIWRGRV